MTIIPYKTIKEQAFECNRQIPELGLAIYTFGNVSAYDSERGVFTIKPSGVAYADLTPNLMVVVDLNCKVIDGKLNPSSGYPLACVGLELDVIAAVVIGGTLLSGGSGYVAGTLIGVLILGLIQTFITFQGTLSSWWTKIVIGVLLFVFVLLQSYLSKAGARK